MQTPTPYPDLNAVLSELVVRVQGVLGANFVGAYLQGSFAIGDFDQASDVDVLIVTGRDVSDDELTGLQRVHGEIFDLPIAWAQHLELSYAPREVLRRLKGASRDPPGAAPRGSEWLDPATGRGPRVYPFWYLNNGARALVRSEHDNSEVVRWVTRERGIVLAGRGAREVIDEVSPAVLRAEVAETLRAVRTLWRPAPGEDPRWLQAFFVTFCCRVLHTLETGEVASKKVASAWAATTLDPRWRGLIERAWTTSRLPMAQRLAPAGANELAESDRFVQFATARLPRLRRSPTPPAAEPLGGRRHRRPRRSSGAT